MTAADFLSDPETVRFLAPDGTMHPSPAAETYQHLVDALSADDIQAFYRDMAVTRAFDEQATMLQRQGQLALWPPSFGQEAAQVGSARAAEARDHIFPSYREHGVLRSRGVDLVGITKVMRGTAHGGWDPSDPGNHNTHLYTLVLGTQTLHATGYAMGMLFDGRSGTGNADTDEAVVVYYGDGASSEGDVHEAMVFAASYNAPVLFFLQNNQWAISVPVSTQAKAPLCDRARGYGLESVRIDGNDVLASFAVTKALLDDARSGGGPKAIEAMTYRLGAHTTSDDPTKYRTRAEEASWEERDPIRRLKTYLEHRGAQDAFFDDVRAECDRVTADLRARAPQLASPDPHAMFEHVYAEPHPVTQAQSQWLSDYEASFDGAGA